MSWNSYIYLSLNRNQAKDIWFGLKRESGTFKWRDGSVLSWSNWHNGKEENKKDCVKGHEKGDLSWKGNDCNDKKEFLCEGEPQSTTQQTTPQQVTRGISQLFPNIIVCEPECSFT